MSEIDRESAEFGNRDNEELSSERMTQESGCSTVDQGIPQRSTPSPASRLGKRQKGLKRQEGCWKKVWMVSFTSYCIRVFK